MKPCDRCGTPITNSESLCAACLLQRDSDAKHNEQPTAIEHMSVETEFSTAARDHWSLVVLGNLLRGLPAAIILAIASQIVTSLRMPVSTSWFIGVAVVSVYGVVGTLTDLLSRRGN